MKEVIESYVQALEAKCLAAAKKGKNNILVEQLKDHTIKILEEKGYTISCKYEGVNFAGETSVIVGHYISW